MLNKNKNIQEQETFKSKKAPLLFLVRFFSSVSNVEFQALIQYLKTKYCNDQAFHQL